MARSSHMIYMCIYIYMCVLYSTLGIVGLAPFDSHRPLQISTVDCYKKGQAKICVNTIFIFTCICVYIYT